MTKTTDADVSGGNRELTRLLSQRDQALACALLAATMTVVVLWGNFGRESPELAKARQTVQEHRALQSEHQKLITAVHAAMLANRQEVERLSQAR